jgi:hypothetical protein
MNPRLLSRITAVTLILGALSLVNDATQVEARPNFKRAFDATYSEVSKVNKTTCNVCHFGDDKKNRNHYGEALRKELKEPKVTDDQKIKDALKAIEGGECKTGKWKERLDKGQPPCTCESNKHEQGSYLDRQLRRAGYESR